MVAALTGRRAVWQTLYATRLPELARAKDPAQTKWPVTLDHCFGRIILDKVVGQGNAPWTQCIKGPAVRTMSDEQVEACIRLGEKIANGEANLVDLDEESLAVRGKGSKAGGKRKRDDDGKPVDETKKQPQSTHGDGQTNGTPSKKLKSEDSPEDGEMRSKHTDKGGSDPLSPSQTRDKSTSKDEKLAAEAKQTDSMEEEKHLIQSSDLAEYRKNVLLALCQVPKGKYTTYAAISEFLKSSPRAVGNAMRNNPFAPAVPCHRVLAADGKIGGYGGQWGQGDLVKTKIQLLREEGLKFDGRGKVVGGPFKGFR